MGRGRGGRKLAWKKTVALTARADGGWEKEDGRKRKWGREEERGGKEETEMRMK